MAPWSLSKAPQGTPRASTASGSCSLQGPPSPRLCLCKWKSRSYVSPESVAPASSASWPGQRVAGWSTGYWRVSPTPWFPLAWQNLQNLWGQKEINIEAPHPSSHGSSPLLTILPTPCLLRLPTL